MISFRSPRVIGHRGASADHPENTVGAFVGAHRQGADWVELDVRLTADDQLVVVHDPYLPNGQVVQHLQRRDLPPSVPTLADALAASVPMGVNVEIKHGEGEPGFRSDRRIADLVVGALASARTEILVSSFDLDVIDRVRAIDPAIATAYLVLGAEHPVDAVAVCVDRGHGALHPWDPTVDERLIERCRGAGLAVNVWTVDDPERIAELAAWGVSGIVTNVPAIARTALAI